VLGTGYPGSCGLKGVDCAVTRRRVEHGHGSPGITRSSGSVTADLGGALAVSQRVVH